MTVSPQWLRLREPADAAARSTELVDLVQIALKSAPAGSPLTIYDLGSGTGSMMRWLAPRLADPQHWIMCDQDAALLELAAAEPGRNSAGDAVTVQPRERDITGLRAADLDRADLVTASALLDLLTADDVRRVVAACAGAGCPALLTITVAGAVELTPPDPLDAVVTQAFNAHQRATVRGRRLLGPDAVTVTAQALRRFGFATVVRPSPWRLAGPDRELIRAWFTGWLDAAREQQPSLVDATGRYARRRQEQIDQGRLAVVVHHEDLLAWSEER
jgi:SAM-dependent methyltransferase